MRHSISVFPPDADIVTAARSNAIQTLRDSVLVLDFQDRIIDLNLAAERLVGQSLEEAAGQPIDSVYPQLARQIDLARAAAEWPYEVRLADEDRERVFDLHLSKIVHESTQRAGQVLLLHEVTERVRSEKQIRVSEEYFRAITENSTDIIIVVSGDGTILYVSSALERILGRTSNDVTGTNILEVVHPDDIEQLFASLAESLETPNISRAFSARIGDQHGRWHILECVANNLLDNPALKGIVINTRDITERTEAEEALRKTEEHIKASLLEKEILLKEIHHRVKNNLQIICSLLNLQSSTIDDPQTLLHFRDSENRIRAMALIHERLYRSIDLGHIDFGPYISDLANSLIRTYGWRSQTADLQVKVDSTVLDMDTAVPCGLIVNELVSNALKHAFPDGRSGKVGIEMQTQVELGQYHLAIWDDGIGIPNEDLDQFTASLGLQLVHSLVNQLNGDVKVDRSAGTRFEIWFPINRKAG